jgi:DNA-binding response OmpR family regulator
VDFDHEVEPTEYCVEVGRPRVLLAEDSPTTSRLTIFHLERLDAEVDHAENGRIAVDLALAQPYDLIMMDIEMPVLDGFAAVEELRSTGYTGMIVAATALTHNEARVNCLKAGCDRYLAKPFPRGDLENLLRLLREEPLFSSLSDDQALGELVEESAAELPSRIRELEIAAAENNATVLLGLVRALKGDGGSYGFDIITEHAAKIEDALLEGASIDDVRVDLDQLERLCTQAWSSLHGTHRHASAP